MATLSGDKYGRVTNMHEAYLSQESGENGDVEHAGPHEEAEEPTAVYCLLAAPSMPREAVVLGVPAGEALGGGLLSNSAE